MKNKSFFGDAFEKNPNYTGGDWGIKIMIVLLIIFVGALAFKSYNKEEGTEQKVSVVANPEVYAEYVAKNAIRSRANDENSIEFIKLLAANEWPNANAYGFKWLISGKNAYGTTMKAWGMATVHFKGGDAAKFENWEVQTARIETDIVY